MRNTLADLFGKEEITVGDLLKVLSKVPSETRIRVSVDNGDNTTSEQKLSGQIDYDDVEGDIDIWLEAK